MRKRYAIAMPRFVVLQHDHPERLHWDFMLDEGQTLATWALATPPAYEQLLPARSLAPHRREYLDYEGPVSQGRGTVTRWDEGGFEWIKKGDDLVVVQLNGRKLVGLLSLERKPHLSGDFCWYLKRESQSSSGSGSSVVPLR